MKALQKTLSMLLCLAMLLSMIPAAVRAESQLTVDSGEEFFVESTNSLGHLLNQELAQETEETAYDGGYSVISLTIEDNIAIVEYDTLEEATLVVALYTEDRLQLLLSGNETVTPEETVAQVYLAEEMPEYFMASAYLLDIYDCSPLCEAYDTPMYTRDMQELLTSTVEDYDAEKVLNLDNDNSTNFAVYAEDTILIEQQDGVNQVVSANDDTATYVIANADSTITSLQIGNVFAYPYSDEDILIVKVAEITLDGTTATITGDQLEIEEVFSHVKMESTGDASDITVDDSSAGEGVTYDGFVQDEVQTYGLRAIEGNAGVTGSLEFKLNMESKNQTDTSQTSASLSGTLNLKVGVSFSYYVSLSRQYLEFRADANVSLNAVVTGKYTEQVPLGTLAFAPIPGVSIGFKPELQLEFSGKIELNVTMDMTAGFSFENKKGFQNITRQPDVDARLDAELTIYVGIDLRPTIDILGGVIASATVYAPVGAELTAKLTGKVSEGNAQTGDSIHNCSVCVDMQILFQVRLSANVQFLKSKELSYKTGEKVFEFGKVDMYWSLDNGEFGFGVCPHRSYRVAIQVRDSQGNAISNAEVFGKGTLWGTTNKHGVLTRYLTPRKYIISAWKDDLSSVNEPLIQGACSIVITLKDQSETSLSGILGSTPSELVTDWGALLDSGDCGAEGDNLKWYLYANGTMHIRGAGKMAEFDTQDGNEANPAPWKSYSSDITHVIIDDSITSISDYAFFCCTKLENITIPRDITYIGEAALSGCLCLSRIIIDPKNQYYCSDEHGVLFNKDMTTLICAPSQLSGFYTIPYGTINIGKWAFAACEITDIAIPETVTSVNDNAFYGCTDLIKLEFPDSVTYIGDYAVYSCKSLLHVKLSSSIDRIGHCTFRYCSSLVNIEIPDGITSIGTGAFSFCSSLENIILPDSVLHIGNSAFEACSNLTSVDISEKLTLIGDSVFYKCENLSSIVIPDNVTSIGSWAFCSCSSLETVFIGNGVTSIGDFAFHGCENLVSVTIGNSVLTIGKQAFHCCFMLSELSFGDNITALGERAFAYCSSLTEIIIPDSVTTIDGYAFDECTSLTNVTIGNGVTDIGVHAFNACTSLINVIIGNGVTNIDHCAFYECSNLVDLTIPESVTHIGQDAFNRCTSLKNITFQGNAPDIEKYAFYKVTATVYYPSGNPTWTSDILQKRYGGTLTWAAYEVMPIICTTVDASAGTTTAAEGKDATQLTEKNETLQAPTLDAVYGGMYGTEVTDAYTLKTASFTNLVPGQQYVLLALKDINLEYVLSADNLLYIEQAVAKEDGTLVFQYVQRALAEVSYVMACGASNKNLQQAEVTLPTMLADDEVQVVDPVVVYNGETLTEGVDYTLVGEVAFTEEGTYTCYIRGIRNYTGLVQCTYTVLDALPGDFNSDATVTDADALYLLRHTLFAERYPIILDGDVNSDGEVSDTDALYLLRYTLFADRYPLYPSNKNI